MSTTTHRRIKTGDGEKFKIVFHGAANFSYIELHKYNGEEFNQIEDWDLRTTEIEGTNVRDTEMSEKKTVGIKKAKKFVTEWLEQEIAEEQTVNRV